MATLNINLKNRKILRGPSCQYVFQDGSRPRKCSKLAMPNSRYCSYCIGIIVSKNRKPFIKSSLENSIIYHQFIKEVKCNNFDFVQRNIEFISEHTLYDALEISGANGYKNIFILLLVRRCGMTEKEAYNLFLLIHNE